MLTVDRLAISLDDFSLQDVSFEAASDDYFVLLGASGVGKSIVLECIAGLLQPASGKILLDGRDITKVPTQRRAMALVYQEHTLFPHMTVRQNIAYGLRSNGLKRESLNQRVKSLAERTGVDELLNRRPATLSGGETQRVALARALAIEPACLLLDEPLSSLDAGARGDLRSTLRSLHRAGMPVVHVTHDYEEAVALATRVGVLENGRITQVDTPQAIFQHPTSEFLARFVGLRNIWPGDLHYVDNDALQKAEFHTANLRIAVTTDARPGEGCLMLRSEDITLSNNRPEGSAQNIFRGKVKDICSARLGIEIVIDIGVDAAALVTQSAVDQLDLMEGKDVWISFKATAGRFIPE